MLEIIYRNVYFHWGIKRDYRVWIVCLIWRQGLGLFLFLLTLHMVPDLHSYAYADGLLPLSLRVL